VAAGKLFSPSTSFVMLSCLPLHFQLPPTKACRVAILTVQRMVMAMVGMVMVVAWCDGGGGGGLVPGRYPDTQCKEWWWCVVVGVVAYFFW
jgi:hypothetical protein